MSVDENLLPFLILYMAYSLRGDRLMVLYYSATGNTEFMAKQIAKRLGDETLNLLERVRTEDYSEIHSDKPFVICMPVHVCEPPVFLVKYLKKVCLTGNRQAYFVFTSGGYAGISSTIMKRLIRRKKMIYMGRAEVKMPRNYIAGKLYEMNPPEEAKRRLREAVKEIPRIAHVIRNGGKLRGRFIFQFEKLVTYPFVPVWTRIMQSAKPFHTTDKCIGCGKCARLCPLNNIEMVDRRPVWKKPCAHCMACIGNCPFEAIEYGEITQDREKYNIRHYVKKEYLK